MTKSDIRAFIETKLLGGRSIGDDENLLLTGLLDSLGVMTLVAHLEAERGAPIPAQDVTLEHFATITAIAHYLGAD